MSGIIDLDYIRQLKTKLVNNIDSLKRSLIDVKKKLKIYDDLISSNEKGYDKDVLEREKSSIIQNIEMIEKVIASEIARSMQCDLDIQAAERILSQHGQLCSVGHEGKHDWQVLSTFPSGNWSKRRCSRCDTEQRLGP